MNRFLGILQFMTRIPVKANVGFDDEFYKAVVYFPSVGAVLGILYLIVASVCVFLFGDNIASILVVLSSVILTGGLHLDGVGDTFDGVYSYRDKDRILEIMKDSRLGTNAMLAILFVILLKIAFVLKVFELNSIYVIFLMPVFGRLASVFACFKNKSPREKGMGNVFLNKVSSKMLYLSILSACFYIMFIGIIFNIELKLYLYNFLFIFILWLFVRCYTKHITKIIGGITGDILGCTCEMSEIIYMIYITVMEVFIC